MSASLVGSEMCIRDRRRPSQPAPPTPQKRLRRIRYAREQERIMHPLGPVSYTHLTLPTICSV
eukprot:6805824-Alexandrium_andersonii.AAC.1